ncbi:MAG TPA: efflux RND transporter periplasmic adaptor subunit [Vicinamibacterales bacterium]|nr:efflux RND transporter periplasmic adaptor subunit [Vicinamibacterales bacterium]
MHRLLASVLVLAALAAGACSSGDAKAKEAPATAQTVSVSPVVAVEQPVARFIRATGSLMAEEQAEVAAEVAGRVVAAPIERGTPVAEGAELVRISPTEADASLQEAQANAAQLEARLGISGGTKFDVNRVPEVQTAKASYDLATSEFNRIESLLSQKVVSQSEYDQRKTQMEATRQQYEAARNAASQQFEALQAARARVALARKAFNDTTVRAPFAGAVAQRLVSTGDYVTKGMKVAVVVRTNPLRVQLTVPEQFVSAVAAGSTVNFVVDAYPNREFKGTVRYVSPALQADQRALTVEALVPNPKGELKPGFFATAQVEQPTRQPGILVPAAAVQTTSGTSRVYVVAGDHAEERIVTTGQTVGDLVEITKGVKAGERIATKNVAQLADGTKVS